VKTVANQHFRIHTFQDTGKTFSKLKTGTPFSSYSRIHAHRASPPKTEPLTKSHSCESKTRKALWSDGVSISRLGSDGTNGSECEQDEEIFVLCTRPQNVQNSKPPIVPPLVQRVCERDKRVCVRVCVSALCLPLIARANMHSLTRTQPICCEILCICDPHSHKMYHDKHSYPHTHI